LLVGRTDLASAGRHRVDAGGIYFGKDPHTVFVNVPHSGTGNDKTMAITRKR
jgi:hypothetical protein